MKVSLLIATNLLCFNLFSQEINDRIVKINSIDQAKDFIEKNPKSETQLFHITSDKDTSNITSPLFNKKHGFTFSIDNLSYKILASDSFPAFRASYIYLDGNQLSWKSIDSIRTVIINKYKTGTPFVDLVAEYTMDGNLTGDTGWFREQMMMKEFEIAVRAHKLKDIFTVDIPSNNWYYVTLKTFETKSIKRVTILRMKNSP